MKLKFTDNVLCLKAEVLLDAFILGKISKTNNCTILSDGKKLEIQIEEASLLFFLSEAEYNIEENK